MSESFDPYHTWLGIPIQERTIEPTPNYYRLLGIRHFESDASVIENAADQRMGHLRTLQAGKHGEQTQKLLSEISSAKLTLLDSRKKAEYDADLRQLRDRFDRYQWLPIASAQPPLTHYQVLGLRPFEDDLIKITQGGISLLDFLDALSSSLVAMHATRLAEEIQTARNCLCNPAAKAEYDEQLRGVISVPPQESPHVVEGGATEAFPLVSSVPQSQPSAIGDSPPSVAVSTEGKRRRDHANRATLWLAVGVIGLVAIVFVAVRVAFRSGEVAKATQDGFDLAGSPTATGADASERDVSSSPSQERALEPDTDAPIPRPSTPEPDEVTVGKNLPTKSRPSAPSPKRARFNLENFKQVAAVVGETIEIPITIVDDSPSLSYRLECGGPKGVEVHPRWRLTWTPKVWDAGAHEIPVTAVYEDGFRDSMTVPIKVKYRYISQNANSFSYARDVVPFIDAALQSGYEDYATELCLMLGRSDRRNLPTVRPEARLALGYHCGERLLLLANKSADEERKFCLLEESARTLRDFLADPQTHRGLSTQATESLVRCICLMARSSHKTDDGEVYTRRETLTSQAYTVLSRRMKDLKATLERLPRNIDPEPRLAALRNVYRSDYLRYQLARTSLRWELAIHRNANGLPPAPELHLMKTAQEFDSFAKKYEGSGASYFAEVWRARCYQDSGDVNAALAQYEALKKRYANAGRDYRNLAAEVRIALAEILIGQAKHDEAVKLLSAWFETDNYREEVDAAWFSYAKHLLKQARAPEKEINSDEAGYHARFGMPFRFDAMTKGRLMKELEPSKTEGWRRFPL